MSDRDGLGGRATSQVEFPELRLRWIEHEGGSGRTPPEIKERLRGLSDRYTGGKAVHLRQEPIPWAYRVFFRQVGIDPDDHRTPAEQAALDRMKHGAFRSRNLLDDALVIATVETGVPVMALDADRVEHAARPAALRGRRAAGRRGGRPLSVRQIVVADADRSVAVLFGDIAEERGVASGDEADAAVQRAGEGRARDQRRGGPLDGHRGTADRGADGLSSPRGQRAEATAAVRCRLSRPARTSEPPAATCSSRSPGSSRTCRRSSAPPTRAAASTGRVPSRGGPRVLSLSELERLRDDLAERLHDVRRTLSDRT